MVTIVAEDLELTVPDGIVDLASFRLWVEEVDSPERPRISYVARDIWVDVRRDQGESSTLVKTQFTTVIAGLAHSEQMGLVFAGCGRLTNLEATFSVRPEAIFVSRASTEMTPVRYIRRETGYPELEGTPDMVLEVVSAGSVHWHTVLLRQAYWDAGIREYWLVDARKEPLTFDILRHTSRGYVSTRKQQGWVASGVFGKSFRLTLQSLPPGRPDYLLEMR